MNMSGAICYLVGSKPKNISDFIESLTLLKTNYLDAFPCPVIAFYEADLSESVRNDILAKSGVPIIFEMVNFKIPEGQTVGDYNELGYRHMCKFFANDIFNEKILQDFKYYCRLDTDSKILSPVGYDLYNWMDTNDCLYGYLSNDKKNAKVFCVDLWSTFDDFVKTHPQFKTYKTMYADIPELVLFYTNFEVCNISWFKKDPWKSFASCIIDKGGIYKYGWGDHNIRYAGVSLYMEPHKVQRLPMHYYHQQLIDTRNR